MSHYYCLSKKNYKFFFDNLDKVHNNKKILENIIYKSLIIKKSYIEVDEFDTGKRLLLNFGHTFGHAIEKTSNFKIPHGIAVAHGIQMALFFSKNFGLLSDKKYFKMNENMKKITNLSPLKKLNLTKFIQNLEKDKKHNKKNYRFILTKDIGKMLVYEISKKMNIKKSYKDISIMQTEVIFNYKKTSKKLYLNEFIEKNSKLLKKIFLESLKNIEKKKIFKNKNLRDLFKYDNSFNLWELSHLYEKNIFKEDCINICLQYLAIIEIIKNHDLQEITLNNIDAETIKVLRKYRKKIKINVINKNKKKIYDHFRNFILGNWITSLIFFLKGNLISSLKKNL